MAYFIGQEDRNMRNGAFGMGDYIYIDHQFYPIKSYDPISHLLRVSKDKYFYIYSEPSFELFMEILGNEWDTTYKEQWTGDEDYTDYVPVYYKTRQDFRYKNGTWYNK
jgi:hypothetical protein